NPQYKNAFFRAKLLDDSPSIKKSKTTASGIHAGQREDEGDEQQLPHGLLRTCVLYTCTSRPLQASHSQACLPF
ncbi:hypothetical protein ACJX0J_006028, partial [Zea mays]